MGYNPDMILLKDRIKELREKKGLLQKEFARKIGVSTPTISAWEQGSRFPNSTQRKKICEFFGITEADLFAGHPVIKDVAPEILEALQDPIAVKALLLTFQSSQDIKTAIKDLLDYLPHLSPQKRQAILSLCK